MSLALPLLPRPWPGLSSFGPGCCREASTGGTEALASPGFLRSQGHRHEQEIEDRQGDTHANEHDGNCGGAVGGAVSGSGGP